MSAVIVNIADYQSTRRAAPAFDLLKKWLDQPVRGYCELLDLGIEDTAICCAVARRRYADGASERNAISAGKDRADRIFHSKHNPPSGPRAA